MNLEFNPERQGFFRYPQTPHLVWLGDSEPRDDKLLSQQEIQLLLSDNVLVEEKLDGANLGVSLDSDGNIQCQNRGDYLFKPFSGQFTKLDSWLDQNLANLKQELTSNLILFGEWCAARHSLDYSLLPDWFLLFDVYDREERGFWSVQRRDKLAKKIGLHTVPKIAERRFTLEELKELLSKTQSNYRQGTMEGIVIRRDSENWCQQRAKLIRPDFVQSIEEHWSRRPIEWNRIDWLKNQSLD